MLNNCEEILRKMQYIVECTELPGLPDVASIIHLNYAMNIFHTYNYRIMNGNFFISKIYAAFFI